MLHNIKEFRFNFVFKIASEHRNNLTRSLTFILCSLLFICPNDFRPFQTFQPFQPFQPFSLSEFLISFLFRTKERESQNNFSENKKAKNIFKRRRKFKLHFCTTANKQSKEHISTPPPIYY